MNCYIWRGERRGNDGKHWNERLDVVWVSREERWVMWTIGKERLVVVWGGGMVVTRPTGRRDG